MAPSLAAGLHPAGCPRNWRRKGEPPHPEGMRNQSSTPRRAPRLPSNLLAPNRSFLYEACQGILPDIRQRRKRARRRGSGARSRKTEMLVCEIASGARFDDRNGAIHLLVAVAAEHVAVEHKLADPVWH